MKQVIRQRRTRHYLREDGTWTKNYDEAKSFSGILAAIMAIHEYQLKDCDLVVQAQEEPSIKDTILPLSF